MPRCPNCKHTFAVLEDEQNMHACPSCGYGDPEDEPPQCEYCRAHFDPEDSDARAFATFCSAACEQEAEQEGAEETLTDIEEVERRMPDGWWLPDPDDGGKEGA